MIFEIISLICTLGQAPQECIPQTARSVYQLGLANNELECLRQAQLSEGKVSLSLAPGEYHKFMCVRRAL